jgi:hypothetical protein
LKQFLNLQKYTKNNQNLPAILPQRPQAEYCELFETKNEYCLLDVPRREPDRNIGHIS